MRVYRPQRPKILNFDLSRTLIGKLINSLKTSERAVLLVLLGIMLVSSGVLLRQKLLNTDFNKEIYTEGIVANSPADVESSVQALTNIGLLTADEKGNLSGLLVDSWNVSDDAKTFEFQLKTEINRQIVLDSLNPSAIDSLFTGATVEPLNEHGIRVTIGESFSPFLATFIKPIIPIGPYIVKNRTKEEVSLVARSDYFLGKPKIDEINLEIFPNLTALQSAVNHKAVNAVAQIPAALKLPENFKKYSIISPRKIAAFFNVESPELKDKNIRQKLIERSKFDDQLTLNVVTTDSLAGNPDVQKLLEDWKSNGVSVSLSALSAARVQTEKIPNRDYDVIIYGIDYGAVPDPYLFWHSSQRKLNGLNLSNFAYVDADKILETIRKTGESNRRLELMKKFNDTLSSEKVWLVICDAPAQFAVDQSIKGPGFNYGFNSTDRFKNVQNWFR